MEAVYTVVKRYVIKAKCVSALHIGAADGDKSKVLVDDITRTPFIQGTSIAGAFYDYADKYLKLTTKWFGDVNSEDSMSRLYFSDASFKKDTVKLELRTRISCDPDTSTVKSTKISGASTKSGQIMNVELVSAGAEFEFSIYQFLKEKQNSENVVENLLIALNNGDILLGGQLSNGCGLISILDIEYSKYNLKDTVDRKRWINEDFEKGKSIRDILKDNTKTSNNYCIEMRINFPEGIMVKQKAVNTHNLSELLNQEISYENTEKIPDNIGIFNGNNEFIIPASSIKGVLRSRVEAIADYMGVEDVIKYIAFEGKPKVYFYDAILTDVHTHSQVRNAIDKFTGGVRSQALFNQIIPNGSTTIKIVIDTSNKYDNNNKNIWTEKEQLEILGLLLFAIRDMAIGAITFGSESSIGLGYIDINNIIVKIGHEQKIKINPKENKIQDNDKLLRRCLDELKQSSCV